MGDHAITALVSVMTAIIGVAIIAVLVSSRSQTSNVLLAGGNAFGGVLNSALSPVTGGGIGNTIGQIGTGILGSTGGSGGVFNAL